MKLLVLKVSALSLIATSGVHAFEYEDESTSSSLLRKSKDPMNRIHCTYDSDFKKKKNIKQACRALEDGHDVAYKCDSGVEICCTESNIKNPTMKTFGTCHIMDGGGDEESADEMNKKSTPTVKSGQCINTGPRRTREAQSLVCHKMGTKHTKAYACTKPGNYCCTPGTPEIVKTDWGVCVRDEGDLESEEHLAQNLEEPVEDKLEPSAITGANQEIIFHGETASIRCIEPKIRLRRGESIVEACKANPVTPAPYTCDEGGKLCCTISSMTSPNLPGYGKCHKLYIPNEHDGDEVVSGIY